VRIVGKERPDLETPAARAQHAISLKPLLALDSKGCPLRLSNPTAEKARTGSGKYGSVIARDLVKGDRGQVKQTAWFTIHGFATLHVERVMNAIQRAVPVPKVEITKQRALGGRSLGT
jgi:hypothetical protein